MFFTKKVLIDPVMEQIDSSGLSKINSPIRIDLATPLKTGLFYRGNTYCVWNGGNRKALLSQNKVEDFLEAKFFCKTFWL